MVPLAKGMMQLKLIKFSEDIKFLHEIGPGFLNAQGEELDLNFRSETSKEHSLCHEDRPQWVRVERDTKTRQPSSARASSGLTRAKEDCS